MEQEKIRKRKMKEEDHDGVVDGNNRKRLRLGERGKEEEVKAPPSEEEVEEFFSILRRMHVAVKYFGKKGDGNGEERKWRAVLESEEMVVVEAGEENSDIGEGRKIRDGLLGSGVLDLNSAPEENHTGAAE